jgi:hypothetical protein
MPLMAQKRPNERARGAGISEPLRLLSCEGCLRASDPSCAGMTDKERLSLYLPTPDSS